MAMSTSLKILQAMARGATTAATHMVSPKVAAWSIPEAFVNEFARSMIQRKSSCALPMQDLYYLVNHDFAIKKDLQHASGIDVELLTLGPDEAAPQSCMFGDREAPYTVVWAHGGGFHMGHPSSMAAAAARWTLRHKNMKVISLGYPLHWTVGAPNHPRVTAHCLGAYNQLISEGLADPTRTAMGGDSAGGNVTIQMLAQLEGRRKPAVALLMSPWLELADATRYGSYPENEAFDIMDAAYVMECGRQYAGADLKDLEHWTVSPSRMTDEQVAAAFSGVKTHLNYGTLEVFRDECVELQGKLQRGNCEVEVLTKPAPHEYPLVAARGGAPEKLILDLDAIGDFAHSALSEH